MNDPSQPVDPALVTYLRRLVTALSLTMIVGFIVIVTLLVIRLQPGAPGPGLPDTIVLPAGARATAFTQARDWYAVVTADDRILVYDRASGKLRQNIAIRHTP